MQPSPKMTLPLITASWQKTLLPPPWRDDRLPRAERRPDVLPEVPSPPRAEVLPEVSAAPRVDVRPVPDEAAGAVALASLGAGVAFFSSSPSSTGT